MAENQFAAAQRKREQEQAQIKKQLGIPQPGMTTKRKVRLDVTLPADSKAKLVSYAEKTGLSVSVVVQMLIDEACT